MVLYSEQCLQYDRAHGAASRCWCVWRCSRAAHRTCAAVRCAARKLTCNAVAPNADACSATYRSLATEAHSLMPLAPLLSRSCVVIMAIYARCEWPVDTCTCCRALAALRWAYHAPSAPRRLNTPRQPPFYPLQRPRSETVQSWLHVASGAPAATLRQYIELLETLLSCSCVRLPCVTCRHLHVLASTSAHAYWHIALAGNLGVYT